MIFDLCQSEIGNMVFAWLCDEYHQESHVVIDSWVFQWSVMIFSFLLWGRSEKTMIYLLNQKANERFSPLNTHVHCTDRLTQCLGNIRWTKVNEWMKVSSICLNCKNIYIFAYSIYIYILLFLIINALFTVLHTLGPYSSG